MIIIDAAYHRRWREANRERVREAGRRYASANREKINARNRDRYRSHGTSPAHRAWNMAHQEELRAYRDNYARSRGPRKPEQLARQYKRHAEWVRENPELINYYSRVRHARKRNAPGSHTFPQWLEKVALLGGCCIYCGRSDVRLTADHKTPLSRGGSNAIENIVPACLSCNLRKHTRTAREFIDIKKRKVA
jgi:5-methylcytosine-specific restriction endonuclease McrA